jgi:hypothetical protein
MRQGCVARSMVAGGIDSGFADRADEEGCDRFDVQL